MSKEKQRVFISYRHAEPDLTVANLLQRSLGESCSVFIDTGIRVGEEWGPRIDRELGESDFLISLLSEAATRSEMVIGEIRKAYRLGKERGKPRILPIRIRNRQPFSYPLNAWLDPLQWAFWETEADSASLVGLLLDAITQGELPAPRTGDLVEPTVVRFPPPVPIAPLEGPEATSESHSPFYVKRYSDHKVLRAVLNPGVTINIKGPRQMGKSLLLESAIETARLAGKRIALLDFQLLDRATQKDESRFYEWFVRSISGGLEIEDRHKAYWDDLVSYSQRCSDYMIGHVLKSVTGPLMLAMDEVDRVIVSDFSHDFFSMLRSWHEARRQAAWKKVDLLLVLSTDPYLLIDSDFQSPFNVGLIVDLLDFTYEQFEDLNGRHGPALDPDACRRLYELIEGHPFLARRALYLVASEEYRPKELFERAAEDRGPFGDHLRFHLYRLERQPALAAAMKAVIRKDAISDRSIRSRLLGAGLIRETQGALTPRCDLYRQYFGARL